MTESQAVEVTGHEAAPALVRRIALLGLAGVAAGLLVGGVGGRLIMRISAIAGGPEVVGRLTENGNRIGEITLGGTIGLLIFGGLLSGMFGAVLVVIIEPWLPWLGKWRGLGLGLFLLGAFGFVVLNASNRDFALLEPAPLNVALFAALFIAYGITVWALFRFLDRRLPRSGAGALFMYLAILGLGVLPLFPFVLTFTSAEFCDCDPPTELGILLLVMAVATTIGWWAAISGKVSKWLTNGARIVGFTSLGLLVVLGGIRTLREVSAIL
jgi:hypothetical protein